MTFFDGFQMGIKLVQSILTADPLFTIILALIFGSLLLIALLLNMIGLYKLKKSRIQEVDQMPGRTFEEYLKVLLINRGYSVRKTPITGDYGVDLILSTKNKKIIVQAKRYKKNVGIKAVQEIAAAKSYYKADECWVITNRFFTQPAKNLARTNQVRLVDRTELMQWMIKQNKISGVALK